jgi:hypothetical protein
MLLVASVLAVAAGCGGSAGTPTGTVDALMPGVGSEPCPAEWKAEWQRLANRIQASVFCLAWLPFPVSGRLGGPTAALSVSPDRSYLITFLQQNEGYELHATMRGYPGRTEVPTCRTVKLVGLKKIEGAAPCFSHPIARTAIAGLRVTVYDRGLDADEHHVIYTWVSDGSLYTLGHHAHHSLTHTAAMMNVERMLRSASIVRPEA